MQTLLLFCFLSVLVLPLVGQEQLADSEWDYKPSTNGIWQQIHLHTTAGFQYRIEKSQSMEQWDSLMLCYGLGHTVKCNLFPLQDVAQNSNGGSNPPLPNRDLVVSQVANDGGIVLQWNSLEIGQPIQYHLPTLNTTASWEQMSLIVYRSSAYQYHILHKDYQGVAPINQTLIGEDLALVNDFTASFGDLNSKIDNGQLTSSHDAVDITAPTEPKWFYRVVRVSKDSDGDGINDDQELSNGTNPHAQDSDNDGVDDGTENEEGSAPNDPTSLPELSPITTTDTLIPHEVECQTRTILVSPQDLPEFLVVQASTQVWDGIIGWTITLPDGTQIQGSKSLSEVEQTGSSYGETLYCGAFPSFEYDENASTIPITISVCICNCTTISTVTTNLGNVYVLTPKLKADGTEDGFAVAQSLKVGKWEKSFLGNKNGQNAELKNDFIGWDVDRFYIYIPNGVKLGITEASLATEDNPAASYNDDANEIDLQMNAGTSDTISASLLLVCDDIDDDYKDKGAGEDDKKNERTHKVQLGGKLVIKTIKVGEKVEAIDRKVPVPVQKTLNIDFIRMNVNGVRTLQAIQNDITRIELYAQVGLQINGTVKELAWPTGVGSVNGQISVYGILPPNTFVANVSTEYKAFIDGTDQAGINIFYLLNAYPQILANGIALSGRQKLREPALEAKYIDHAFIHSLGQSTTTPSHELLHLLAFQPLAGDDHDEYYHNLLATLSPHTQLPVLFRKRLNAAQETKIHAHSKVQPVVPSP